MRFNSDNGSTIQCRTSCLLQKNIKISVYETIILAIVLYGCETCPLTLREGHTRRLRVFETMVLRRIFRPEKNKVTRG
jgi:hypothetical protein